MHRMILDTDWLLTSRRNAPGVDACCEVSNPAAWHTVTLPKTAQAALVEQSVITDPWLDRNAKLFEAFEGDTWVYRREFEVERKDSARYDLVLEGVSIFGTVWLNGALVGHTRSAHHEHVLDITRFVHREGRNVLVVECSLNLDYAGRGIDIKEKGYGTRAYVRSCGMSFGWDFAPKLQVAGLWRPVSILCHDPVSVEDVHISTDAVENGTAKLSIGTKVRFNAPASEPAQVKLSVHETPDGPAVWESTTAIAGEVEHTVAAEIPEAKLWFPRGYGEAFLYTLKASVSLEDRETDATIQRFGIRTIELKQDDQFTFCINGVDVFSRGANWVPSDSLTLQTRPEQYRHLLTLAHEAHFNMLRVWGGGIYEPELFYELCDELGIMVWQDFMYACGMYPDDDHAFMQSAEEEARAVVKRLRRHASVVLWCGNNECQEAWVLGDWPKFALRHMGERLYDNILPDTVSTLSPETPYWPGSPYGGPTTRSRTIGDFHDWYSLPKWRTYEQNAPRFSSEYGFRAAPERATFETMISEEYRWDEHSPQNNVWEYHHGVCGWTNAILPEFGDPKTLDEYIMFTQETQATIMRHAVEVYRRRMFETSGSLIWQYNEPWPAMTFAMVDYYGRPKASYYWVKNAHKPVMVMFRERDGKVAVWAVNDTPTELSGTLSLRRLEHLGARYAEEKFSVTLKPAGATELFAELPPGFAIGDPTREYLTAELACEGHASTRVLHLGDRRNWKLSRPRLRVDVTKQEDGSVLVEMSTKGYAHFVSLHVADPHAVFSDNYVDVPPTRNVRAVIRGKDIREVVIRAAGAEPVTYPVE